MKHINNKFYNYKNGMQEINHIKNVGKKGDVYIFTNFEGKGGGNFTVTIKESKYSGWVIYVDENKTRKTNINIKFENDYEQYTNQEKCWIIEVNNEQAGTIYKNTAWSGSSWTVTHYTVEIDFEKENNLILQNIEESKDFNVVGAWSGKYGCFTHRKGFLNSRTAFKAAKKYATEILSN